MKIDQSSVAETLALAGQDIRRFWIVALGALVVGLVGLVALFFPVVLAMADTWYVSSTYNHGFLILPIAIYMAWQRRPRLVTLAPQPTLTAIPLMLGAGLLWYLGNIVSVEFVKQLAFVGMVQILAVSIIGWRIALMLAVPLLYLLFAVPFGEFLIEPLQDLTAVFVVKGLQLVGVPVYLDGVFISIPTGNFEVAEACAGLRYLIAMLALAVLFADVTYRTVWRKLVFLAFAIVIPVVANGIRAFGIVMLAYSTNNRVAVGIDHIIYGWVFFSLVTILVLVIGTSFRERDRPGTIPPMPAIPLIRPASFGWLAVTLIVALASAAAAPVHAVLMRPAPGPIPASLADPLPRGWDRLPVYAGGWEPRFAGADAVLLQSFTRAGKTVHLAIGYYAAQRDGAEIVSYETQLLPDESWSRAAGGTVSASIDGHTEAVNYTRAMNRRANRVIWHWYWVGGEFTASPLVAKLLQGRAAILGGTQAAAYIAIAADYEEQPADAHTALAAFIKDFDSLAPLLERAARR
ncbi:MAG: exosortase A [Alphaproteobacteria bacterium]